MTDTNDPFAARPYVPPAERDDAAKAPSAPSEPAPADPTPSEETPQRPPESPTVEAPAADAESDSDSEPTIPVTPTPTPASEPHTVEQPAATTSEQPAAESVPPAEAYTHRYADAPSTPPAAADSLPPFAEPTIAFPAEGGSGHDEPPVTRKRRPGRFLAGALAIALLAGGAGYGGAVLQDKLQDDDDNGSTVSSLDTGKVTNTNVPAGAVQQVAKKVAPSVVQINVKGDEESGSGTGIIISSDGEILTNNHVTAVAGDGDGIITVAFNDGSYSKATVVGADPKTDLAVIKASGKSGLTPATLGSSADLEVGQEVVAIGSPFGLESTVTQGIISALNRPVTSSDGSSEPGASNTFPAIQTDAAINPGNSGGPLVDIEGNVIGINSAIKASGSGEGGSIGLGFAIPIDLAKNVSRHLVKGEKVEHAQIGVTVKAAVSDDGITGTGAEIADVTAGGAGDKAGLKKGDIITAVNGDLVASNDALVASVRGFQPGEKVTLTYLRDGEKRETEVTLGSDGGNSD
ncbi:trypsin-like peptidase domain-containing protein [Aeromicrobium sp.]|uniref:trypsin-like peptidase domain-containing protein n=1 Tax=Aeromicrobium sp. TaxID=1871063 RepID=UPI002FCA6C46